MDDEEFRHYLEQAANEPLLSREEEERLGRLAAEGDEEAMAQLVRSNLRLVIALARRYVASGVPLVDLVQEGNLALMRAVQSFDPGRGFRFSTHATWFIRKAMGESIRAQVDSSDLARLQEAWDGFVAHAGRQPTIDELATESGLSVEEIADLLRPPAD
ncbi:MAG TPA: sigma-70 family RNA polymerase sigma factor [Acidimicrobiales bacterium]|nr:sigma-70 family RNA polymerase sigma factor [Acidimicrobiales bacterium]